MTTPDPTEREISVEMHMGETAPEYQVRLTVGVQSFTICQPRETLAEASWLADQLGKALDRAAVPPEAPEAGEPSEWLAKARQKKSLLIHAVARLQFGGTAEAFKAADDDLDAHLAVPPLQPKERLVKFEDDEMVEWDTGIPDGEYYLVPRAVLAVEPIPNTENAAQDHLAEGGNAAASDLMADRDAAGVDTSDAALPVQTSDLAPKYAEAGPLLDLDGLLGELIVAVQEHTRAEGDDDLAGVDQVKAVQQHVRRMLRGGIADRPSPRNALRLDHPLARGLCTHGIGMCEHCPACASPAAKQE